MADEPSGNVRSIASRVLTMQALVTNQYPDPATTAHAFNDLLARAKILAAFCLCPAELPVVGKRARLASIPDLGEPAETGGHDEDRDGPIPVRD